MKYTNNSNKSFKNIKEEMELKALRYALSTAPNLTGEVFRTHKKYYMERYFNAFPQEKQKYDESKRRLKKVSVLMSLGMLGIATIGSIGVKEYNQGKKYSPVVISEETDTFEPITKTQEQIFREKYGIKNKETLTEEQKLAQEVKELSTEDEVNKHRKEIIAELYNKEHPDLAEPMTPERIGIIKKSLNYLYNRRDETGKIIEKVTEKQKQLGDEYQNEYLKSAYEFYIDDELVAFFHQDSIKVININIGEKQDEFFGKVVEFLNASERLKDSINRKETTIDTVKKQYLNEIESLQSNVEKNRNESQQSSAKKETIKKDDEMQI